MSRKAKSKPLELALVGEVEDWEKDVLDALLDADPGSECIFYIDSSGGSVYGSLAQLLRQIAAGLDERPGAFDRLAAEEGVEQPQQVGFES